MTFQRGQRLTAEQLETRLTNAESYSVGKPVDTWSAAPIDRTGTTDCSAAFALAMQASAAAGEVLLVPPGNYLLASSVYAYSGLRMICSPRARFIGRMTGGGTRGMVMLADAAAAMDPTTRQSDILIEGGIWGMDADLTTDTLSGLTVSVSKGYECTIFNLFCDRLTLRNIVVDKFPVQRAIQLCGDDILVENPTFLYPSVTYAGTGNSSGGLRYGGGKRFRCVNGFGVSADDCWQLVPFSTGGTWGDLSIEEAYYIGCTGIALKNRLAAAVLLDCDTASIRNSGWVQLRGKGSGKLIGIENLNPDTGTTTGRIDGIVVDGFSVADTGLYDQPQAIDLLSGNKTGGIGEVVFQNGEIRSCKNRPILSSGDVDCLTLRNVKTPVPDSTDPDKSMFVRGAKRLIIDGCDISGGQGAHVLTVGGNSVTDYTGPCSRVTIRDTVLRNTQDTYYALRFVNTDGAVLSNVACIGAAGATSAGGVQITSSCTNIVLDLVDCTEVGGGTTVSDAGTGTVTRTVLT